MKVKRRSSVVAALGSMTAAVALLAGAPDASAQQQGLATGGGSFPGSFLVPGTNTSIKIGGYVKLKAMYDMDARNGDTIDVGAIPLQGSANAALHGATRLLARQSNLTFDTRTPTAYGDLTTFIQVDMFGQNTSESQSTSTTQNARLVYGYGTLGPFLAGQWVSLWSDTDAIPENVDGVGFVGVMDGNSNRVPQVRYTFAAPGGFSAALSVENPEAEGVNAATGAAFTTSSLGGVDRYPDLVARARIDQAWGHAALSGFYRDLKVVAPAPIARASKPSYGIEASGHLNTFGKDSLKATAMMGKAIGHYMSSLRNGVGGIELNEATGAVGAPNAYGVNVGYTHWWTTTMRSTVDVGYAHLSVDHTIVTTAAAQNALDKRQYEGQANLIWSPVPQVDLGVEYEYGRRVTWASTATTGSAGNMHRIEVETVFKF